ncbi:zf-HC2 domain-containing protein [Paenibacillus thermoaerophilus]|uniref:Anti-sigma-W factor RsiW n=1 Tax=Paenibacillus thermoaerophilus TaxID=1215385 RepID=A0ABW2V0D1_9BACL|nr:zf-HC2 domain-containing protein [Paenibacillus thermoaerophilus]TMV18140.1 anti-sigma factor [Paenibacillus thermoaerophilus]
MDCKQARILTHEYLDGDLSEESLHALREHLKECAECLGHYRQLSRTAAMIRSLPSVPAPHGLKDRIMASLPPQPAVAPQVQSQSSQSGPKRVEKSRRTPAKRQNWFRRHPGISVAAVFALVMAGSYMAIWNQGDDLVVRGDHLDSLVIENRKVVVPAGKTVGNLTVENGDVEVEGKVDGNLVVIDGSYQLASTAQIAGNISEIDRALDWVWFKIQGWASKLGPSS